MFKHDAINPDLREAIFRARIEYASFERTLKLAVKVTVAQAVGVCMPENVAAAELNWHSVECSVFDDGNKEID